jgi:hypothetical protein
MMVEEPKVTKLTWVNTKHQLYVWYYLEFPNFQSLQFSHSSKHFHPKGTLVKKLRKYVSKNIWCDILVIGYKYKLIT